jgi:2-polyprenyl-3-methyl-5-hydroxy-6-metoxy-1,4-benzoquinol methylase
MGYSREFIKLIKDKKNTQRLLSGSGLAGADFKVWERARLFISEAINAPGSILDIGCGNGFLLRCLQEWSKYKLIP